MKRYVIAGNWKMNKGRNEVKDFFAKLADASEIKNINNISKIICPSFPLLDFAKSVVSDTKVCIGAQDVCEYDKGAYTGEVSAAILESINIEYCIIGHSERRQYFKETDELVKQKWLKLRANNINPIICVGETLAEREAGNTFDVIKKQITTIFEGTALDMTEDLLIAYEPVWAIGTGKTATPDQAQEVHKYIRELLLAIYGDNGNKIPLLYGGSVKATNIKDLLMQADIDGALIGGASLDADEYIKMVKIAGELV
jgi:triosephosphate isomerase